MADQRRDWDKEMAAIDQVIAKGGYVAPSGAAPVAPPGTPSTPGTPSAARSTPALGGRAWLGMWMRTLLGVALSVGLMTWPWSRGCGIRLYWYLGGVGTLGVAALWIMLVAWRRRSGLSHILGLLMLGYAVWLGAVELLPRIGYARIAQVWSCPAQ